MKDDLIKILNYKLKQIRDNIASLNSLNEKIGKKTEELEFIKEAIKNFESEDTGFDIYKFSNIDRETFNKLLMNLSSDVLTRFGTDSCNYDGLIYLINGINSGISLTLTQEQKEAINLFIDKLLEKEKDYQGMISLLNEEKQKLDIRDLDVLMELENKYSLIIENVDDGRYVVEIDEVIEAINYSNLSGEKAFDLLWFLLKYNSEIYNSEVSGKYDSNEDDIKAIDLINIKNNSADEICQSLDVACMENGMLANEEEANDSLMKNEHDDSNDEEMNEESSDVKDNLLDKINVDLKESDVFETTEHDKDSNAEESKEEASDENSSLLDKADIELEESNSFKTVEFDDNSSEEESETSIEVSIENEGDEKKENVSFANDYNPILTFGEKDGYYDAGLNSSIELNTIDSFSGQTIDIVMPSIDLDLPTDDESFDDIAYNDEGNQNIEFDTLERQFNENEEETDDNKPAANNLELEINEDDTTDGGEFKEFSAINKEEIKPTEENKEDKTIDVAVTSDEIKNIFDNFGFEYNEISDIDRNLLLKGDANNYNEILSKLEELKVAKYFKNNINLLIQILLYSETDVIDEILRIVEEELSIDENDKNITFEIICKTMPSVFIKGEFGNYDNFIKNIDLLKSYGIDLINLFDFSREVLLADNKMIMSNYNTVSSYNLTVNAYNAKYLLLLSNVGSKIDYYVESIYKDNSESGQKEMFDGLEMIKLYPNKLNTVCDETIKRLRYSSEKGLKLFGTKEKSLTSEITNLNVNRIEIPDTYLKSLFNNEFDIIRRDEFYNFVEMVNENHDVELVEDELLNKLDGYKIGLRYFIGNINISVNKVIRNYNILVNNNVEKKKALLFAICYNLVISKTEYDKIKSFVENLGGN